MSIRAQRPRLALLAAGAMWTALSGLAAAESNDEYAKLHFQSGAAYFDRGEYESALREFEKAYELSPRPGLLLNIATVHERLGAFDEAVRALDRYVATAPGATDRADVETRAADLRKRADASRRRRAEEKPDRTAAWVAFGIGGAAAAGAVVTGFVASSKYSDADRSCAPRCEQGTIDSVRAMAWTSTALTAMALGSGAVGAWLWLRAAPAERGATVAAGALPGGGVVEATWRFR